MKSMRTLIIGVCMLLLGSHAYTQTWDSIPGNTIGGRPIEVYQNKLIIQVFDTMIGPLTVNGIASWDGMQWDSLGKGLIDPQGYLYGAPFDATEYNGNLYAMGVFDYVNEMRVANIARWNGTNWSQVGPAIVNASGSDRINVGCVYKNELYVGGHFKQIYAGSFGANHLVRWNESQWLSVGGGVKGFSTEVNAMTIFQDELYVAGSFVMAGSDTAYNIARWNGAEWNKVGILGTNGSVNAIAADSLRGYLYAGGVFTYADSLAGDTTALLVRWDGNKWSRLPFPFPRRVGNFNSLTMYHHELYATATCYPDTGAPVFVFARMDSIGWHILLEDSVQLAYKMQEYRDTLHIGGEFRTILGDTTVRYLAKYYYPGSPPPPRGIGTPLKNEIAFSVFPNPANAEVTIRLERNAGAAEVRIMDINGREMKKYIVPKGQTEVKLNIVDVVPGTYLVTVQTIDGRGSQRLILTDD